MSESSARECKSPPLPDGVNDKPSAREHIDEADRTTSVSSIETTDLMNVYEEDRQRLENSASPSLAPTAPLGTPFQPMYRPEATAFVSVSLPHESNSRAWGQSLAEAATRRLAEAVHTPASQTENRLNPEAPSFMPGQGVWQETAQQDQQAPHQRRSFSSINDQNLARFNATNARMNAFETIQVAEVRRVNRLETCLWALTFVQGYIRGVLQRREEEAAAADVEAAEADADGREGDTSGAPNVENDSGVAEEQTDRNHDSGDR